MMQPLLSDRYEVAITITRHQDGQEVATCDVLVPGKDFDLTAAGFAAKYFHMAADILLVQFHAWLAASTFE